MGRMKNYHWPAEPPAPRPPSPVKHAIQAAWCEFWRVLKQQRRRAAFLKDTTIF